MSTFAAGYAITKQRADEKKLAVLKWLYQFNVSTQRVMAAVLGVDGQGQYAFFGRLKSEALIESFKHPALGREFLFRLTDQGRKMAAIHHGLPLLGRRYISQHTLLHDLTAQLVVCKRAEGLTDYVSERNIGAAVVGKIPDVLLTYGADSRLALEMELTHKNSARVFHAYLGHLRNIRDRHYDQVAYVFTSPALRDLYQSKFEQARWPVFTQGQRDRLVRSEIDFEVKPEHRKFFSFELEQAYFV